MKHLMVLSGLVVLVAVFVVACGPAPTAPPPVVQTVVVPQTVVAEKTVVVPQTVVAEKTVVVEKLVTPTAAPPPPERLARAENLIVAVDGKNADPTNFNMYTWANAWWQGLQQVVYEFFFYQNLQTGEYIPWLAEKYEYSKDFTSITVTLRKGVMWNDGKPFTPEDVIFTYDTLLKNPGMAWAAEVGKWVKSVEKVDDLTVKINLGDDLRFGHYAPAAAGARYSFGFGAARF
jgi:peptide/nickel transport system substrate-binding protein